MQIKHLHDTYTYEKQQINLFSSKSFPDKQIELKNY